MVDDGVAQRPQRKDRATNLKAPPRESVGGGNNDCVPAENTKLQEADDPDSAQLELVFVKSGSDRRG